MAKVSIQDIADKSGVSKGTVSLILNGKAKGRRISEATCEKVLKIAADMNYQPNEIARSLITGKTMTIGVVITDISNEFFGYLTFYIQEQAKKYGYSVIVANSNENLNDFSNAVTSLLNRQTDGIIMVPVDGGEEIARSIVERHVPMVQIDRYYPNLNSNYIVVDNYEASSYAVEALVDKGCKKIAVVCYDLNQNTLLDRKRGCIDVLEHHHLLDTNLIKNIDFSHQEEEIKQAIIDIKNYREKVDAIYFCSRRVFTIGLKYIYQEGIKVPEDVQLLCFDKMDFLSVINLSINYIEQPIQEMGEKAVDILMKQIDQSTEVYQQTLKTKFCIS